MQQTKEYLEFRRLAQDYLSHEYGNMFTPAPISGRWRFSKFTPCNNNVIFHFDETSLFANYKSTSNINGLPVLYGIYDNRNRFTFYVGETEDFGQRINTHSKDGRKTLINTNRELYHVKDKVLFIFGIFQNATILKDAEKKLIRLLWSYSYHKVNHCNEFSRLEMVANELTTPVSLRAYGMNNLRQHCYNIKA